jgi:ATP-GRASP peptide maturase of grasp-with-spasm system
MAIIIFSESLDNTTSLVMKWMFHYGERCIRINQDDENIQIIKISRTSISLSSSFGVMNICAEDFVWFRRVSLGTYYISSKDSESLKRFQVEEKDRIYEVIIEWILDHCRYRCNPHFFSVCKPHVLTVAEQIGIKIPEWTISNSISEIKKFVSFHDAIAIKPLEGLMSEPIDGKIVKTYTKMFYPQDLDGLQDPPISLFVQKYIHKKYELRIFFFERRFFSAAIFSQKDSRTQIDFRKYNDKKPNRRLPFNLPVEYQKKMLALSKKLHLDSGSIDVVVDNDDNWYFLEVNPIGQFGMISSPCNYNIEQYIANKLIKNAKQKK